MITTQTSISLSVEEFALAMSLAGSPETGKLFLNMAYGELTEEDEQSRLYAAGHSMVARDLVAIVEGRAELSAEMQRLLSVLTESDFSIQYIKEEEGLATLVYAVQGDEIVEQASKQGVAYQLTDIVDRQQIVAGALRFFGIASNDADPYPEAFLPLATLEALKTVSTGSLETIVSLLQTTNLPDLLLQSLAQDFHQSIYHGAILRMERQDDELRSDRGIFTLGSMDRVWLFPLVEKEDEVYVRVALGSAATLTQELEQLLEN